MLIFRRFASGDDAKAFRAVIHRASDKESVSLECVDHAWNLYWHVSHLSIACDVNRWWNRRRKFRKSPGFARDDELTWKDEQHHP